MSLVTDADLLSAQSMAQEGMDATATITSYPTSTSDGYGNSIPGTPSTTVVACSFHEYPLLFSRQNIIEGLAAEKLKGRTGWRLRLPYGTAIDRTCRAHVVTHAGGVYELEVLKVIQKETNAIRVTALCAELAK